MKILHVITSIRRAAGTSIFVVELANELVVRGHEVSIAVINPCANDACDIDSRIKLIGISELGDGSFDVVHIHALWTPILHKVSTWAHKHHIPIVWSPHGMLQKWALKNKWWKKIFALALYQWWDLKKADLLHATAETEVEDIRRLRLHNRVVVAPLGVRVKSVGDRVEHVDRQEKTLLFVSRVQKKKGLPVLVDAWAALPEKLKKDWRVRIVGPDQDNHTAELLAQCERLGIIGDFTFTGPKYGDDLEAEYRAADLFVLPTHSENFGSVVVEALARGVPVICSQGAPWQQLETERCGWWVEDSVVGLTAGLKSAMQLGRDEMRSMGLRGEKLIRERYTWSSVCHKMINSYSSLVMRNVVL